MSGAPLDVGVLSTAHPHSAAYRAVLADLDGVEFVGVADEDAERGRAFAADHDTEYAEADDLLARIDAAVVCAANADHGRWVERAADAGVDVLCEKPLATTVEEAVRVRERCADAGVELGVAMPLRFSEPARRAREAVRSGALGEVQSIVGTNLLKLPSADWFVDAERSGGGAVMDHTVHVVDLVRWITGREVTEVYAELGTRIYDVPVEDLDVLSMELDDGTPFTHDGSWRQPEEWDFWGDSTLRLVGTEGVYEADCFGQTFRRTRDAGEDPGIERVFWGDDPNAGMLREFCDAVRAGRTPETTPTDGVREVAVVEAAYESGDRGEPVAVDYP